MQLSSAMDVLVVKSRLEKRGLLELNIYLPKISLKI